MRALLLTLLLCLPAIAQTPGLATVRVYSFQDAGETPDSLGSGWLIENDKVVTAAHVIRGHRDGNKPIKIRFNDNWKTWATVLAVDEKYDIALLWINPHENITRLSLKDTPKFGKVAVHGYGYDFEYRYRLGWIAGGMSVARMDENGFIPTKPDPEGEWRAIMCCAIPGDSGGPVTLDGQVIGSILATNAQYCVFCPIEIIRDKFSDHLKK